MLLKKIGMNNRCIRWEKIVLLCFVLCLCCGCSNSGGEKKEGNREAVSSPTAENTLGSSSNKNEVATEKSEVEEVVLCENLDTHTTNFTLKEKKSNAEKNRTKIVLVGNSLLNHGNNTDGFSAAVATYGESIQVLNYCEGDYDFSMFCEDLESGNNNELKKILKQGDVIILQGKSMDSPSDAKKIVSYAKKSAKIYLYETEFVAQRPDKYYQKLCKSTGGEFIYAEELMNRIVKLGYDYESLHATNDFHPNYLNGYIAQVMMYTQIFGENPMLFDTKYLDQWVFDDLIGDSMDEKVKSFKDICKEMKRILW